MTATASVLTADAQAFESQFPLKPFRINHALVGDARLELPAILELVKSLPRDRIEYNSGKVAVNQDAASTPLVELPPEEVVAKIQTAGAWMVLKRIEHNPVYKGLLEEALMSVAFPSCARRRMCTKLGRPIRVPCSLTIRTVSPGAISPFSTR